MTAILAALPYEPDFALINIFALVVIFAAVVACAISLRKTRDKTA